VHDFLYWDQSCSREQADALLRVAMAESKVGPLERDIIWQAVRRGGESAWLDNARAKAAGQLKFVPKSALPIPPLVTWPEYRSQLQSSAVPAPQRAPAASPAYCTAGNLENVRVRD